MTCPTCGKDDFVRQELCRGTRRGFVKICNQCDYFQAWQPYRATKNLWEAAKHTGEEVDAWDKRTCASMKHEYSHEKWTKRSLQDMLALGWLPDETRLYIFRALETLEENKETT